MSKLNRHARKRQHQEELKKRHAKRWWFQPMDPVFDEMKQRECAQESELFRDPDKMRRNGGYRYWETFYLSGRRKVAKQATSRKIRAKYRNMIASQDLEEIRALKRSEYEQEYDYWWTVF